MFEACAFDYRNIALLSIPSTRTILEALIFPGFISVPSHAHMCKSLLHALNVDGGVLLFSLFLLLRSVSSIFNQFFKLRPFGPNGRNWRF